MHAKEDPMSRIASTKSRSDISIVLCGQAGMGIQTVERFLTRILKLSGYNVFATKEYMSRIRGGTNSTSIRVSSQPVRAFVDRVDILIPLDRGAVHHVRRRISADTTILAETANLGDSFEPGQFHCVEAPFTKIATDIGNKIYSNIVAVGTIAGLFGIELQALNEYIRQYFSGKSQDVVEKNIEAVKAGHELANDLARTGKIQVRIGRDKRVKDEILLSGAEAVGLGAIAGGCNFIAAYPMSPSTGVLAFFAQHAREFGVIAEQAEDEIAAMNMAIGAWYAGARAMVTTSGGGFALMTEGLSLSSMLEVPIVVHLAQRPGPATGLPTRTEQADLELALYAGHGEFPRMILTPGTLQEAFYLTQRAFNLADKYQVPVFVLTDQYLIDSYYNTAPVDLSDVAVQKHVVKTDKDYRRHELTADGISPRGVPGYGQGLVCVDSDEHDTQGHITEDLDVRIRMVEKRLKKAESLEKETIEPELVGRDDYRTLVVCWGSTYHIVAEAMANLDSDKVAFLHFKQVHPLPRGTADYLRNAERTVIVEGNATCQLGKQIKLYTGLDIDEKILKYNGLNFTVEEVAERLGSILD
jgi:2-oxoglutarate ferredoxin oxidoreductase subunit alpha